jgi:co-chaperonin GroES (HSP10)
MITSNGSPVKLRAIHDHVLVSDMDFGEIVTAAGIVLRSDDGKTHGVKPRWGKVYAVGPKQHDVCVGQWILIEHGRWTRKAKILTASGEKQIQRVDVEAILAVSDQPPTADDIVVGETI